MSTETTLQHHLDAFDARDVDEIMKDYDDASVLITGAGVARGREQIRPLFEGFFGEALPAGCDFELTHRIVEGEVAYVLWTAETDVARFELRTDTFVIRDGKIVAQTAAVLARPKETPS